MTIPLYLTIMRILAIPFFIFCFYLPTSWGHMAASVIFALAALTDWLDGYLARTLSQTSKLGAFLDPVADKLLVATALVLVVGEVYYQYNAKFLAIPAAIIVCREITISALREWMAEMGMRAKVAVKSLGKLKTIFQMLSLIILIAYKPYYNRYLLHIGCVLLYLSAVLTLWSMIIYLKIARISLTSSIDDNKV